jgi:hypothetical protein
MSWWNKRNKNLKNKRKISGRKKIKKMEININFEVVQTILRVWVDRWIGEDEAVPCFAYTHTTHPNI